MSFNESVNEFLKLPEWMFISIILYADTLAKSISFFHKLDRKMASLYHSWVGAEKESLTVVYISILGITISSVLLMFIIFDQNKKLDLPSIFYNIERIVFCIAVVDSFAIEYIISNVSKVAITLEPELTP